MTGPPISASTQTKSKLKAFQFIEGRPASDKYYNDADKENRPIEPEIENSKNIAKPQGDSVPLKKNQTPRLAQSKKCPPSTPATRLPLAVLVGNSDDRSKRAMTHNISPDEQLCWQMAQSPTSSNPTATPAPRRSKKRARSSSPPGPSQTESSTFLAANESFDLQNMQQILKTPQADPAAELWNRYTVNASNKGTPTTNKGIAFAHLINESSPHSSATAGSVSGLRRWASCGLEWPTSATKRRKTRGVFREDGEDVFGVRSTADEQPHRKSKLSKVGLLVERIQETLAKPPRQQALSFPSSSSPLPETGDFYEAPSASPLQRLAHEHMKDAEDFQPPFNPKEPREPTTDNEHGSIEKEKSTSSSEFGDVDMDMVEAIEIANYTADVSATVDAGIPVNSIRNLNAQNPPITAQPMKDDSIGSDDEFGLGDEDNFTTDLENLASLYDSRPALTPTRAQGSPRTEVVISLPNTPAPAAVGNFDANGCSDDEFGSDDIDVEQFAAAEAMATQAYNASAASQAPSQRTARTIQRYLVTLVTEGHYKSDRGHQYPEKVLLVKQEKTKLTKVVTLRQSWFDTPCTPGSFVHVIGEFMPTGQCLIDDANGMLILHPDHLISATVVADSFSCLRRAVLQDRVKATSRANAPMLYGTVLHELFQEALKANRWDSEWLHNTIQDILPRKFETILEIGASVEQVLDHLKSKLPELQSWAEIFVHAKPKRDAIVKDRNGRQAIMSINKLLDVEEHVWSPEYGLKGNIDATVQVVMQDDLGERVLTVPFEIKTGKNSSSSSHRAQTALYTLLLSDRYDVEIAYGILYYLETSEINRIPAIRHEIRHMVMKRNELACYVRERLELPPMLREDHKCNKCYAQESCFLYHKLVEDGTGEILPKKAKERFDDLVRYLKPSDQEFMRKWDTLLTKEESDMMKFRRELWTMLSIEREKLGRCFSNVILEPGSTFETNDRSKINRYSYTFVKRKPPPGFSFVESQLIIGEPIVISDEKGHFALANGYVTNVRKRCITVAVDRRLHNARTKQLGFDPEKNQVFAGIMEVSKEGSPHAKSQQQEDEEPVLYRLDKDEFSNGMAAARNNLIQMMNDSVFKARELRSLIVEGNAPAFKTSTSAYTLPTSSMEMSMNSDQKAAIEKVMSAQDYALVLGMPGTGKTTTIAHIIRALVAKGKSVLVTSYTHTAVDNILLKIRNDNIGILRLGAASKIHPEVRDFATLAVEPKQSVEELEKSWIEPPVVATTCLTISHPLFSRRIFDYCIVDEASQITLPVCLGPIRMAKTFVLVGDHFQLPPLVQNKEAAAEGLDVSLFKLLSERHPQAVVTLEHQYRMCADVMFLSNMLIYSGRLKCGTEAVASRSLTIPNIACLNYYHRSTSVSTPFRPACPGPELATCWLSRALLPESKVIFLNTDLLGPALESASGSRIVNTHEACLITQLTTILFNSGVPATDVGIVAFYRSQLALLKSSLQTLNSSQYSGQAVELHTADKFQGRDKEVILVSCVRSNTDGIVGDLLKDQRRINVALTRARSKLVIVGSAKTLASNGLLKDLIELCRGNDWFMDLTPESAEGHAFEDGLTQTDATQWSRKRPTMRSGERLSLTPSPRKKEIIVISPSSSPIKRKTLGEIVGNGYSKKARRSQALKSSPDVLRTGRRSPQKVVMAGKRGILGSRPVLRDIMNDAL